MKLRKHILIPSLITLGLAMGVASCGEDNPIDSSKTVVIAEPRVENDFDKWLAHYFMTPYNIELRYRMKDNETSLNYNLAPAELDKSVQMAHLVKYLCLEAYDEATGSQAFVRTLFPKLLDLIGSPAYNTNGTMVLGTAEGGRKMTLYMVNELKPTDSEHLNRYYFKTVHHEFGHIQNQTKPYPQEFQQITATGYVSDSWSSKWNTPTDIRSILQLEERARYPKVVQYYAYADERTALQNKANRTPEETARISELATLIAALRREAEYVAQMREYNNISSYIQKIDVATLNALRAGFISPYASSQHAEDFVEIQSIFMTDAPALWEAKMRLAGSTGRALIQEKYNIVESYLQNDWGISLVGLRDIVLARQAKLGEQDLTGLTIK